MLGHRQIHDYIYRRPVYIQKRKKKYTFWIQSITQPHLFTHPDDEHVDISLHSC